MTDESITLAIQPAPLDRLGAVMASPPVDRFPVSALPLQRDMVKYFGNPAGPGGAEVSRSWYAANLVRIPAPWEMNMGDIRIREMTVHRKVQPRLVAMLHEIKNLATVEAEQSPVAWTFQDVIDNWGLNAYGGGFNYRVKRSGSTLSCHAFGIAWDFDPARNGFRDSTPRLKEFPKLLAVIKRFGVWGGDWATNTDGMHIQFARVS